MKSGSDAPAPQSEPATLLTDVLPISSAVVTESLPGASDGLLEAQPPFETTTDGLPANVPVYLLVCSLIS